MGSHASRQQWKSRLWPVLCLAAVLMSLNLFLDSISGVWPPVIWGGLGLMLGLGLSSLLLSFRLKKTPDSSQDKERPVPTVEQSGSKYATLIFSPESGTAYVIPESPSIAPQHVVPPEVSMYFRRLLEDVQHRGTTLKILASADTATPVSRLADIVYQRPEMDPERFPFPSPVINLN